MDGVAALLCRMAHMITIYKPRLTRAIAVAIDEADGLLFLPPNPSPLNELQELCEFFGIDFQQGMDHQQSSNDRLLYDSRRLCKELYKSLAADEFTVPAPGMKKNGANPSYSRQPSAHRPQPNEKPATPASAADPDQLDPLHLVRSVWLSAVTLVPEVSSWQQTQTSALAMNEPLPLGMQAALELCYADQHSLFNEATRLAATDTKENPAGSCRHFCCTESWLYYCRAYPILNQG